MSTRPFPLQLALRLPVTLGIAAITLVFFGVEHLLGGATDAQVLLRLGALRADRVAEHGEVFRLFMPILLHAGWLHLLLNGLAFLQLGTLVEVFWGSRRMLLYYLLCGLGGSLASAVFNQVGIPVAVGGSGAILGLAGLVVGASMYGEASLREELFEIVGRRLVYGVLLTFALGVALWAIVPVVDNWAHLGGFVTGMLLAGTSPDPREEDVSWSLPASAAAGAALVASIAWMVPFGGDALEGIELRWARDEAALVSEQPDHLANGPRLVRMLEWYADADSAEEGEEVFRRLVDNVREPVVLLQTVALLEGQSRDGVDVDEAMLVALERWLALRPEDPRALNAMAWRLTQSREELRDPDRAVALARDALHELPADGQRAQRARTLDTLAEALYLRGDYSEAEKVQEESIALAQAENSAWWTVPWLTGELPMEEFESRLDKIREAAPEEG